MRYVVVLTAALTIVASVISPAAAERKWTESQIMAKFAHEPSVQRVQDKAVRYYMVHPERIRSLRRNAQLKALLPTISGEFSNQLGTTLRKMDDGLYPTLANPKEDEKVHEDALGWRVQASWVLDRLVFNAEVLDVQSLIGILDGIVREVTTIYYIRRRLQIDMVLRPPADLATRISQKIRIEELTGLLDAMTGGYMSKAVTRSAKKEAAMQRGLDVALRRRQTLLPRRGKN